MEARVTEDCPTFRDLVNVTEDRLVSGVLANPDLVQLHFFPNPFPPPRSSNAGSRCLFKRTGITFPESSTNP